MANIETGKELRLENVLSLRKKMGQEEINQEMMILEKFFEVNGITKTGPIVTTTYSVEPNGSLDMEILAPMDREIELLPEYKFKPIFKLTNAVYARHEGSPALLQSVYNEMMEYIQKNKLQQITSGYNATVSDAVEGMSKEDVVIDVYIGVSDNIL